MSNDYKVFDCPVCGTKVPAVADYIARGVKCQECGAGFSPIPIKQRERRVAGPAVPYVVWGILAIAIIALFVNFMVGAIIAIIALLAGIFVRLGRK